MTVSFAPGVGGGGGGGGGEGGGSMKTSKNSNIFVDRLKNS